MSFAQTTVTFKPNAFVGKDACLWKFDNDCIPRDTTETPANVNHGAEETLWMKDWTWNAIGCSGGTIRSLLCFTQLNSIPNNAIILNATLRLYGTDADRNTSFPGAPSSYHDNTVIVQEVTSAWDENTVTWNTQPTTTTANQFTISPSTSEYNWDCTISNPNLVAMVQNMVSGNNYGFMLRLQTEQHYRNMVFSSSDNPNSALWPELEITYSVCNAHFSYCLDNTGSFYHNFNFTPTLQNGSHIWTVDGVVVSTSPSCSYPMKNKTNVEICHTLITQYDTCECCVTLCKPILSTLAIDEEVDENMPAKQVSVPQGKIDLGDEVIPIEEKEVLRAVPNPTKSKWEIVFQSIGDEMLPVEVYNIKGDKIYSKKHSFKTGDNTFEIDCSTWEKGVYVLKIQNNSKEYSIKIEKR